MLYIWGPLYLTLSYSVWVCEHECEQTGACVFLESNLTVKKKCSCSQALVSVSQGVLGCTSNI